MRCVRSPAQSREPRITRSMRASSGSPLSRRTQRTVDDSTQVGTAQLRTPECRPSARSRRGQRSARGDRASVQAVQGRVVAGEQIAQARVAPARDVSVAARIRRRSGRGGRARAAKPADHLRLVAFDVDPDQAELLGRHARVRASAILDAHAPAPSTCSRPSTEGGAPIACAPLLRGCRCSTALPGASPAAFATMVARRRRKPIGLDVHGQKSRVASAPARTQWRARSGRCAAHRPCGCRYWRRRRRTRPQPGAGRSRRAPRPPGRSHGVASRRATSARRRPTRSEGSTKNRTSPRSQNTRWPRAASACMTVSRSTGRPTRTGSSSAAAQRPAAAAVSSP